MDTLCTPLLSKCTRFLSENKKTFVKDHRDDLPLHRKNTQKESQADQSCQMLCIHVLMAVSSHFARHTAPKD